MKVMVDGRAVDLPRDEAVRALNEQRATMPRRDVTRGFRDQGMRAVCSNPCDGFPMCACGVHS